MIILSVVLVAFLGGLLAAGLLYQTLTSTLDARKYPPPGKLVDVGGYRLHLYCTGPEHTEIPTVVLEAGMGGTCLSWSLVQPQLEMTTRVCSYDRAGYGWSDSGPNPRTSHQIVTELHALLQRAAIPGPYVLVGHSFGGLTVRLYAAMYPDEVAGLVLLNTPPEKAQTHTPSTLFQRLQSTASVFLFRLAFPFGIIRLAVHAGMASHHIKSLPQAVQPIAKMHYSQAKFFTALSNEQRAGMQSFAQAHAASSALSHLPLIVLSGDRGQTSPDYLTEWQQGQHDLANLSTRGTFLIAEQSGHSIQFDRPDLVVQAITTLLSQEHGYS